MNVFTISEMMWFGKGKYRGLQVHRTGSAADYMPILQQVTLAAIAQTALQPFYNTVVIRKLFLINGKIKPSRCLDILNKPEKVL
ncbi:MAG: hypothetical protein K2I01_09190 [Lachnospiraceae bacterium]|nr:hypothetical protein [Lachnospiraceae bacterium]